ncbi:MAG TPA: ABC transporter permease subunit [Anaerolineaceae bacterium]|nr:ABC transporter permease subunit [Anaerolineaceae bacterium]
MAENLVTPEALKQSSPRPNFGQRLLLWLRGNPVMVKELRSRMRGRRAFLILTLYLLALALMVGLVYFLYLSSINRSPAALTNTRQLIGKVVFAVVVGMQLVGITFIAPALTSGAISGERDRQTLDLLQTTLLPARSLALGKFSSALVFMLLLLLAALPLESLAFLFGGVAPEEVAIGTLLLIVTTINFCAVGLFFSGLMKSTLASTVLGYAFPILTIFGLPMMALILSGFFGPLISGSFNNNLSPGTEQALLLLGWSLVSIHPIATAVASEALLLDQHTLFSYQQTLRNGASVTLISPWIPYTIINLLFSAVLIYFAIRFVRRRAR